MLLIPLAASAQNVGINTANPTKLLSVAGSIAVDHDNANTGTLDSAALVFGTNPSMVGISSKKTPGPGSSYGLDFWTNGEKRMVITEDGTVGISAPYPDENYDLYVGGDIRANTMKMHHANIDVNANILQEANVGYRVNINGNELASSYRLTVNDGHSYFDGNGQFTGLLTVDGHLDANSGISASEDIYSFGQIRGTTLRATEYMGVGGQADPTYRLRVWSGNSRFGGDVQVTGTLDADEITTETINGTGVMRSNGPSSLRMGFSSDAFHITLPGGSQYDVTVNIADFEGGDDDVRVFISQFDPDPLPQYANWHDFSFHVHSVDPVNDTCKVRITNTTGGSLTIKGTLYLASVAKD